MRPVLLGAFVVIVGFSGNGPFHATDPSADTADEAKAPVSAALTSTAHANRSEPGHLGCFVANLGQWEHGARFVHRSGPMTVFLEDRGWVLDLLEPPAERRAAKPEAVKRSAADELDANRKIRGVAVRMTFEGTTCAPDIVGEHKLAGHHNYFLGNDESRWRSHVPLYASVRYERLYPGIDLRLRDSNGVPEYDLLLQPGADLSVVSVHVAGGQGLSIASDGSLVMATPLGPVIQTPPRTWQVDSAGRKREVTCRVVILGAERFGFSAPGWDGESRLTIDPGLIWSTYAGSSRGPTALSVDASGVVTWAGVNNEVNRLDPAKTGSAQLVFSTFVGGNSGSHVIQDLVVDAAGGVTVAGVTNAANFPTTSGAYDRTYNGGSSRLYSGDAFVSRLDPSRTGNAQLVYSTFLGGSGDDSADSLSVDANGVVTVAGSTRSAGFPTTSGAYDTTHNGGGGDAFISRLDPSRSGSAQLVYSTFLGGSSADQDIRGLAVDARGVVTAAGLTYSSDFPTTRNAYGTRFNGGVSDAFVTRLDPSQPSASQLVFSTFLGGSGVDAVGGICVDAGGAVTVGGYTASSDFPTTSGAYSSAQGGYDAFVSRLDPSRSGRSQLVYSTFLGGSDQERLFAIHAEPDGVITVAGETWSVGFPVTVGAHTKGASDAFITRLDPSRPGRSQLVYSTFLGGRGYDAASCLFVDVAGVVTVGGGTLSVDFPTTSGAYSRTKTGGGFVSRLSMGVAFYADRYELDFTRPGTQNLHLDAGKQHAGKSYAIFGSITGTSPGIPLPGIHVPLNYDHYTAFTIGSAHAPMFVRFQGTLDTQGEATASFNLPPGLPTLPSFTLFHAYVVYDALGKLYMASNAVPVRLR